MNFDFILANINRNILIADLAAYALSLKQGGDLFISGILTSDLEIINKHASDCGLTYNSHIIDNNWLAVHFKQN